MSWMISRALIEDYVSLRSSQALAAEYSAGRFSGGGLFAQLNANPMPQAFLPSVKMTDFSRPSRFGMTFAPLTESLGEELLTLFREDSRARTSALPARAQESTGSAPAYGGKWRELSVRYDRDSCSWRTHRCLFDEGLEEPSVILPRWGLMRDGVLLEPLTLALRTAETDAGLWPTPTVCGNYNRKGASATSGDGLATAVKMWPTPCARDHFPAHKPEYIEAKRAQGHGMSNLNDAVAHPHMFPTPIATEWKNGCGKTGNRAPEKAAKAGLKLGEAVKTWPTPTVNDSKNSTLPPSQVKHDNIPGALLRDGEKAGGALNPTWVEWLMGWPLGWTDLKPLVTDKSRNAQQQHGDSYARR